VKTPTLICAKVTLVRYESCHHDFSTVPFLEI